MHVYSHSTIQDFIDEVIGENLDVSFGSLPVTHARCAAELKKIIDHVRVTKYKIYS